MEKSEKNPIFDVTVIGNVGIDTNVYFNSYGINFEQETTFTRNIDYIGQAGGYASRGYVKLGKKTAFIGSVGDDFSGRHILYQFEKDGIDMSAVFTDPAGTARSINFMEADGRRKNFYDGKGHMTVQPDLDRCRDILKSCSLAHFHIPNWARLLLPIAKENNVTIACDIQDVTDIRDEYRRDFIQYADILFLSQVNHETPDPLIRKLQDENANQIVIVGMGNRGCAIGHQNEIQRFDAIDSDDPIVDTNGAGDSLAVGFLCSYVLDGYTLEDSILRGQIAARHCCSLKADTDRLINAEKLNRHYNILKQSRSL